MPVSSPDLAPGHVGLSVTDLDRSLAFYRTCSISRSSRSPTEAGRRFAFLGAGGRLFLTLWQQSAEAFEPRHAGLHHLAFQVPTPRGRPGRRGQAAGARADAALRRRRAAPGGRRLGGALLRRPRRHPARGLQPDRRGRPGRAGGRRALVRVLLMGPFHEGELEVQRRAGVAANAARIGRIIRSDDPGGRARGSRPSGGSPSLAPPTPDGRVWATLLRGRAGFLSVPADDRLRLDASPRAGDPLAAALAAEADLGAAARSIRPPAGACGSTAARARSAPAAWRSRRARCTPTAPSTSIRARSRCPRRGRPPARRSERASRSPPPRRAWLATADTLFLASRHPAAGADVSHRGGEPGFARVAAPDRLLIPDYAGNMMFNTLGNLAADPPGGPAGGGLRDRRHAAAHGPGGDRWDAAALAHVSGRGAAGGVRDRGGGRARRGSPARPIVRLRSPARNRYGAAVRITKRRYCFVPCSSTW